MISGRDRAAPDVQDEEKPSKTQRKRAMHELQGALAGAHPGIDTQRLRALVRNTREERNAGRPPRAYRELFRALRDIIAELQTAPDHDRE